MRLSLEEAAVVVETASEMVGMHPSWEEAVAVETALEMVGMVLCLLHRNHRTEHYAGLGIGLLAYCMSIKMNEV
jgi:hypothetical protein